MMLTIWSGLSTRLFALDQTNSVHLRVFPTVILVCNSDNSCTAIELGFLGECQMANGYVTTTKLRALLVAEVTNEEALLEVLQTVQWSFKADSVAGDAITVAAMAIDGWLTYECEQGD